MIPSILYRLQKAPVWSLFALTLLCAGLQADVLPTQAGIATAHPAATGAGFEILDAGGNAFDAAVAVTAALAVVEPYSSGIGGGGFWLLHRAVDGRQVMIDGREKAPLAVQRDMYLDASGSVIPGISIDGPLAAGIPGEPAALVHIAENYGKLPLARSLAPAIKLARDGFAVDEQYRQMAGFRVQALRKYPKASKQFLLQGDVPPVGHLILQPALADTLQKLADEGAAGFYRGAVARQLVAAVRKAGGIWSLEDLAQYSVVEREPVVGHYLGFRVVTAALPSSGGIVLVEMLNMLQQLVPKGLSRLDETDQIHLLVEVMRLAYEDRAGYLGDSDFIQVPQQRLLSQAYAKSRADTLRMDRAGGEVKSAASIPEGTDTTHFSIMDRQGNRVAATLSINYPFGACFVAGETGVLLNDEMDDFSARQGVPNVYGLVGSEANAIAPGKRMLSSMTPSFVESEQAVAILGTPGGSRIITMVLLGLLEMVDGRPVEDWVSRGRFHHQYLPNHIMFEPGAISEAVQEGLENRGQQLKPLNSSYGNMQAVLWNRKTGQLTGASDPRGGGLFIGR